MAATINNNKQLNYHHYHHQHRFSYVLLICVMFLLQQNCYGLKLPDYIKPCALSDPKINECIKTHAQKALAKFANGDLKYHVPSLLPVKINEIILEGSNTIKLTLKNVKLHGLENIEFTSASFNKNNTHNDFNIKLKVPALFAVSDYEMKGQISFVPILNKGPSNITFTNCHAETIHNFDTKQHNGKDYLHFIQNDVHFNCTRVNGVMKNSIRSNDILSEELNKLLTQNWKIILDDLEPAVSETMKEIMKLIFTGYTDRVAIKDFFLP